MKETRLMTEIAVENDQAGQVIQAPAVVGGVGR